MIEGDSLYVKLRLLNAENPAGVQIEENGHLKIKHFDLVKAELEIFDRTFALEYEKDSYLFGNLRESINRNSIGLPLEDALCRLFLTHQTSIFIAAVKSFGIICCDQRFYLTDTHSCGPKGASTLNANPAPGGDAWACTRGQSRSGAASALIKFNEPVLRRHRRRNVVFRQASRERNAEIL
ncbi:hypothetical protein EVAR_39525_1 [Eumeta japonica]|uniref:Uncharacterized protein n=1 Tax=Eumeta variegata TaxID=151549 RepID=A0A4C1XMV4_EUMVA|nr:hypothetical protein EVAR_39525_1 [Eumeta japonica]